MVGSRSLQQRYCCETGTSDATIKVQKSGVTQCRTNQPLAHGLISVVVNFSGNLCISINIII